MKLLTKKTTTAQCPKCYRYQVIEKVHDNGKIRLSCGHKFRKPKFEAVMQMNYSVQAYTLRVGDILSSTGMTVASVTGGPRHVAVTTSDGKTYTFPNGRLVGIK